MTAPLRSIRVPTWLRRARLTLSLVVERRTFLFVALDLLILFQSMMTALVGGAQSRDYWIGAVVLPLVIIVIPVLSNLIAVERRSGSLDLALSTTGSHVFFVRRAVAVTGIAAGQALVLIGLVWLFVDHFPLLPIALEIVLQCLVVAAIALFWAVRLQTAGGVLVAALVTEVLLGKWTFHNPIPDQQSGWSRPLLFPWNASAPWLDWLSTNAVLALAAVILFLYADRRLRRPELMLS